MEDATATVLNSTLAANSTSNASGFSSMLLGNEYFSAGIGLLVTGWIINMTRTWIQNAWEYLIHRFVFSISISKSDEAYTWLVEWLAEQPYAQTTRNLTLRSSWSHAIQSSGRHHGPYYHGNREPQSSSAKRPELYYVPAAGVHVFFHKGALLWFSRKGGSDADGSAKPFDAMGGMMGGPPMFGGAGAGRSGSSSALSTEASDITLTALGYSRQYLEGIVKDAMELYYSKSEGKTWIHTLGNMVRNGWTKSCERKNRSFESVILPEDMKTDVLADIRRFMDSSDWYRNAGVPYRRGYLLYGPPGTGKTSLILSIAGHLNASVCMLNLNMAGLTDNMLNDMLHNTPSNSIILLEDIDCAFVKRNVAADLRDFGAVQGITFSGLLNALDGVASQEGRILFMTTNHIERLSSALMRPGRIDKKVNFSLADKYQIEQMFIKFFPEHAKVAKEVSSKIKEYTVSPAELQGLYLNYRDDPTVIPSKVKQFLEECEMDRRKQEEEKKKEEEEKKLEAKKMKKMRSARIAAAFDDATSPTPVSAKEEEMNEMLDEAIKKNEEEAGDKNSENEAKSKEDGDKKDANKEEKAIKDPSAEHSNKARQRRGRGGRGGFK